MNAWLYSRLTDLNAVHDRLLRWFLDRALPFWDRHGVDRQGGGYFETLDMRGPGSPVEAAGSLRRGRVVARQIYVFDLGRRLGWRSGHSDPVLHGGDYLFARLYRGAGRFHTALDAATHEGRAPFDLYEHAFYLFALAHLHVPCGDRYPVYETALASLERLRVSVGLRLGGFGEGDPPSVPLRSNPHMHLLEAALAWLAATEGTPSLQQPWQALAEELVRLGLEVFRAPGSGAIREYFDASWQPYPGPAGRVLEPGHQYEWAWLFMRFARWPHTAPEARVACKAAAQELIELAERFGVDAARGIAMNELWDDLTVKDDAAKLWPQAERLKAWCGMLDAAANPLDADRACRHILAAAHGMLRYLRADAPALWHEMQQRDGSFSPGPCKASSFYHVAGSIEVLRRTVAASVPASIPAPNAALVS